MKLSQSMQDYLKAILVLSHGESASTKDIATHLGVSPASVTGMLKKLDEQDLANYESYKGVRLTHAGRKIALEMLRHHRLIETYLVEDKHLNVKATNRNDPKGKQAITHYAVVDSNEHATLVDVTIETGRRHQIRMAMQYLGHPVCGDEAHGSTLDPFGRICLHATALEFIHPQTPVVIFIPPADCMTRR